MLDQTHQTYPLVQVNGKLALFTNIRVNLEEIPEGLYLAHICVNDNGEPCSIEPHVVANYGGTVMFREEIIYTHGMTGNPYIPIVEHGVVFFGVQVTISGFLNHGTECATECTDNTTKRTSPLAIIHNHDEAVQFIHGAQAYTMYHWEKPWANGDTTGTASGIFIITVTDQLRVAILAAGKLSLATSLREIPLGVLVENLIGATVYYAPITVTGGDNDE